MKHQTVTLVNLCLIVLLLTGTVKAQQVVSTSGSHMETGSVQLSWTIGETVIETLTSVNNILTQGMHQSKLTITAVEEFIGSGYEIFTFPNPATDCIHLKLVSLMPGQENLLWKDFSFKLYNLSGKLLIYKHIEDAETVILMNSFAPSTYFLKVIKNNKEIRTFKIIKQ